MFGYLRFILAFNVMLSHIGIRYFGLNFGVVSVVIFYILAGFVVSHLFRNIFLPAYSSKKEAIKYFYIDRLKRIYLMYIIVSILTVLFLYFTSYAQPVYSVTKLIYNVLIIPINYYMYLDSNILTNPAWQLIPPAWSLGTELQAYILLPFMIIFFRLNFIFALISFAIYMFANLSMLHSDYFGYRFLAGVFFIFIIGSSIQRYEKRDIYFITLIYLSILIASIIFSLKAIPLGVYTKETFIGLFIGIPLVIYISKCRLYLPYNNLLGDLSYALFLTHFLGIWMLDYIGISSSKTFAYIFTLSALTIFISYILVLLIPRHHNQLHNNNPHKNQINH